MLGSVHRTSLHSLPSLLANSRLVKRTIIKKKVPISHFRQVNFTEAEEILQNEPVMAGMFTIYSYPAYVLFDFGASHSFMSMGLHKGTVYLLWLYLLPIESVLRVRSYALILGRT